MKTETRKSPKINKSEFYSEEQFKMRNAGKENKINKKLL